LLPELFHESTKSPFLAFLVYPSQKVNITIVKGMKRKVSSTSLRRARRGSKNPEHSNDGGILLSKGGSVQMSVKGTNAYAPKRLPGYILNGLS
jgi:hypothetical protein